MEAKGIICKVTEPTEWVNSLICVEKPNGKLRVCLDLKLSMITYEDLIIP